MVTERDSGRSSQRLEETPDQFVIRLKNYLEKWIELFGSSSAGFDARVDLIVEEQFINTCSKELTVHLLERGPKDLVELTAWAQQYLIAHKKQLGGKAKSTDQPKRAEHRKPTQSKLYTTQGRQKSLQCYRCQGYGTVNQNVRQKSVLARIRRVQRLLARVIRRRLVQWWQGHMKVVKRLLRVSTWSDPGQVETPKSVIQKD